MQIRWRLMILLLVVAVVPVVLVGLLNYRVARRLERDLPLLQRQSMREQARRYLDRVVNDHARLMDVERQLVEMMVRRQADAVEERLRRQLPADPTLLYFAEDFESKDDPPPGMRPSEKHPLITDDGSIVPRKVSYEHQVIRLSELVDSHAVAHDVAWLATMTEPYRSLYQARPHVILEQFTSLISGVHSSYPGRGGYTPDDDPRNQPWHVRTIERGDLTWQPPLVDPITRQVTVTIAMPVRAPDGTFVGVTGIQILLTGLVPTPELPVPWASHATILLTASVGPDGNNDPARAPDLRVPLILAQYSSSTEQQGWRTTNISERLETETPQQMRQLVAEMTANRAGVRPMPYHGRESLWAYSPIMVSGAFVVVIVPYESIIAGAREAGHDLMRGSGAMLGNTVLFVIIMIVIVALIAWSMARTVTRPLDQLTQAVRRLAQGDLSTRADIPSGDEIGQVAQAFNNMVPQLQEHLGKQQAYAQAMQVKQCLLPAAAPRIEGLDIAGQSIYCEQIGGDYYDFLEFDSMGPNRMGIAIGDVTGQGTGAALFMATARAILRGRAAMPGSLAQVIGDVNRHLCDGQFAGRSMTLFYMVVNNRPMMVRWVGAGHDPPIVYDPQGDTFTQLKGGDIPLGVKADAQFPEFSRGRWQTGQLIVLGTDGIWNCRNREDRMFGKEALHAIIRDHADRSADQITQAVTNALHAHRGDRPLQDDFTLVVVKVV